VPDLHVVPSEPASNVVRLDLDRRYVGLAEAGTITDLSKSYIHQQVMAGAIPAFRVGRRILIAIDDLDQFVRRVPA